MSVKLEINPSVLSSILSSSEPTFVHVGKTCVQEMVDYYREVYMLDHQIQIWRVTLDDSEFRTRVQEGDRRRSAFHDSAMASLSVAARLAEKLGLDPLLNFRVDDEYRGDVADAMFEYVETVVGAHKQK